VGGGGWGGNQDLASRDQALSRFAIIPSQTRRHERARPPLGSRAEFIVVSLSRFADNQIIIRVKARIRSLLQIDLLPCTPS